MRQPKIVAGGVADELRNEYEVHWTLIEAQSCSGVTLMKFNLSHSMKARMA
jgi:hypothetical protein